MLWNAQVHQWRMLKSGYPKTWWILIQLSQKKKELADEIKTQLEPTLRLVKETQIELQEAQAEIMEALSVIQHTSQSKEHFVTQIDLQNLRKKLSTELKNELVDEIRSVKTTQIELQEAQVKIMEALSLLNKHPKVKSILLHKSIFKI